MKRMAMVLVVWVNWAVPVWAQLPGDRLVAPGVSANSEPRSLEQRTFEQKPFDQRAIETRAIDSKPADSTSGKATVAPVSPGEAQMSPEMRQHELYLLHPQAAEESVIRAAKARADERTRRLESRRWFGFSNQRPSVSADPYNGDYAPHWVGTDPIYPYRWVGGANQSWVIVTGN